MSKTPAQEIDDKIETLHLQLIEEDTLINALTPVTITDHMGDTRTREQLRRMHEAKRDAIKAQIAFLTEKKVQMSQATRHGQKPKQTKQALVYSEIVKMKARNAQLKDVEAIEILADKWDDSVDAIHKAFYAEQKRLIDEKTAVAKAKRDSGGDSDQQNQGKKKSQK